MTKHFNSIFVITNDFTYSPDPFSSIQTFGPGKGISKQSSSKIIVNTVNNLHKYEDV